MIFFFVLKPLGEGSSDLYFYQIDDFGLSRVLDPDERFLCFGISCCPVGSFM